MIIGRKNNIKTPSPFSHATIFFYLLKESLVPIFLAFSILTMLVFSQQIARNLEFLLSPFSSWQVSSQILFSLLPGVVIFTLPISLLVGITIVLGKLSAESEWVAMEALALRRWPRLLPFILLGLAGTGLLVQLTWYTAPQAIRELRGLRELITVDQAALQIRPRSFITNIPNHLLQIKSLDRQSGMWKGVLLTKQDPQTKNLQVLAAQRGFISEDINKVDKGDNTPRTVEIKLQDGVSIDKLFTPGQHESVSFKEYIYRLPLNQNRNTSDGNKNSPTEITGSSTSRLLRQDRTALPKNDARQIEVEIYRRFVLSFACLFAVIVACALNFNPGQRNTKNLVKLVVGFLFCILFYVLLSTGQAWGLAGKVPVGVGLWAGSLISLLTLWLYLKVRAPISVYFGQFLRQLAPPANHQPSNLSRDEKQTPTPQTPKKARTSYTVLNLVNYLLLSEVLKFFAVALGILIATVLLFTLLDISPSLSKNNFGASYALGYLGLLSPQMAYYFAPFALLLAFIITAAALARTGQLTVLLYYANSLPQIFLSLFIFCLVVLGSMYLIAETVLPVTNREQDERFRRIKGRTGDITSAIAFDRKWVLDENGNVAGFKVNNLGRNTQQFDVLQFRLKEEKFYLQEVIACPQAQAEPDKTLRGVPSFVYLTDDAGLARLDQTQTAQPLALNLTSDAVFKAPAYEASKMSLSQLKNYIRDVESVGLPITSLKMDKAQRLTFPFACLSLACLALPLVFIQVKRSSRGGLKMVSFGIALALIFWVTLSLFETAGKNGLIPIDLAAWAPHGLFISLAAVLHAKLNAT